MSGWKVVDRVEINQCGACETARRGTATMGMMRRWESGLSRGWMVLPLLALAPALAIAEPEAERFLSPLAAVGAVLEALRADADATPRLSEIFGPDSGKVLSSGDEVADQESRRIFLEHADLHLCLDRDSENRVVVSIGEDDWPFPIPLEKDANGWYFDTQAGVEEIVNRRIGRNELHALATVEGIVDAEHEYYSAAPVGQGQRQYTPRFTSNEGTRDGLYWPVEEGESESPLGPLVAEAVAAGYGKDRDQSKDEPRPYHGYLFRILTAQGPNAPGGARNYLTDAGMTGGFAVLAYPAEHGNSGIMTFIASQQGIVYQKDLGSETATLAEGMTEFDPDASWEPVVE